MDVIVGVLALSLALFIIASAIHLAVTDQVMSVARAKIIAGVITAIITLIGVYIGEKI